jgi:hypothetical protein
MLGPRLTIECSNGNIYLFRKHIDKEMERLKLGKKDRMYIFVATKIYLLLIELIDNDPSYPII